MGAKDKLIFFVDDEKLILNLLEYTFNNREGYAVRSFQSGKECVSQLHLAPRVVVVDHFLTKSDQSGETGLDLLKAIKKEHPEIEVVVLSSQTEKDLIAQYMSEGAFGFIRKNEYFIDELIGALEEIFKKEE